MHQDCLAAKLDPQEVGVFVDAVAVLAIAEPVETHFMWRPQLRNPADELMLKAAVNGQVTTIVTFSPRDLASCPDVLVSRY